MNKMMLHLRRFGVRMTADRKRFGLLCTLLAVAMLFWTRLIVIKQIPRTALADEAAMMIAADSSDASALPRTPVEVILPARPLRDPFMVSDTWFPIPEDVSNESMLASTPNTAVDPKTSLQGLRLEAAMPPALAVIDGRTRRPGESLTGTDGVVFKVIEIRGRTVLLEHAGEQYQLSMSTGKDR